MKRYREVKIASILGIVGNIFLLFLKGIIGFLSNSQAMIADSFNSFGDVFSSLIFVYMNGIHLMDKGLQLLTMYMEYMI